MEGGEGKSRGEEKNVQSRRETVIAEMVWGLILSVGTEDGGA